MEKMRWNEAWPYRRQPSVITLGFFDGLHRGHRRLVEETSRLAQECGAETVMMSFEPHPTHVLAEKHPVPLIYGLPEKEWVVGETGKIDHLVIMRFEPELMDMEPEQFVAKILVENFHAAGVVIGSNFRFGRQNRGNAERMLELCRIHGMRCSVISEVQDEGLRISSSRIRRLLREGRMEEAGRLLGRPYFMLGTVEKGRGLGSRALVPTVNLLLNEERQYPAPGVYVTRTFTKDGAYESVSNIGHNPTVGEGISLRCETYLMAFDENLYGRDVRIEFYKHLRPEKKFESMEALRLQQQTDIQNAREYFAEEKE